MKTVVCLDSAKRTSKAGKEFFVCSIYWEDKTGFKNTYTGFAPKELVAGKKYEASIGYRDVLVNGKTVSEPYLVDVSDREVK